MADEPFDAIVIGAGMAGLCCAGELVVQGLRPLLISETKEVGAAVAWPVVKGNIVVMQVPTYQVGWGGGWWAPLARRLGVPVEVPLGFNSIGYELVFEGHREISRIPQSFVGAADLTRSICRVFPMVAPVAGELERILHAATTIPYQVLADEMDNVLFTDWLAAHNAGELVTHLLNTLCGAGVVTSSKFFRENISVYGGFGTLRSAMGAEAMFGFPYPDIRRGLAIPMAQAIERNGGEVWRGKPVARVDVSGDRVGTVHLKDGTEVKAPIVAMACNNLRLEKLFDPIPTEAVEPIQVANRSRHKDYQAFSTLSRPVMDTAGAPWKFVLSLDGTTLGYFANIGPEVPWALAEDTVQASVAAVTIPFDDAPEDDNVIFDRLHNMVDFYNPGYLEARDEVHNSSHPPGLLWFDNMVVGAKLPRKSPSVDGLWYVSQGSKPNYGVWMEAGSSAGILGARQIAAERR